MSARGEPVSWLEVPDTGGAPFAIGRITSPPGRYVRLVDVLAWLDAYPTLTAAQAAAELGRIMQESSPR